MNRKQQYQSHALQLARNPVDAYQANSRQDSFKPYLYDADCMYAMMTDRSYRVALKRWFNRYSFTAIKGMVNVSYARHKASKDVSGYLTGEIQTLRNADLFNAVEFAQGNKIVKSGQWGEAYAGLLAKTLERAVAHAYVMQVKHRLPK